MTIIECSEDHTFGSEMINDTLADEVEKRESVGGGAIIETEEKGVNKNMAYAKLQNPFTEDILMESHVTNLGIAENSEDDKMMEVKKVTSEVADTVPIFYLRNDDRATEYVNTKEENNKEKEKERNSEEGKCQYNDLTLVRHGENGGGNVVSGARNTNVEMNYEKDLYNEGVDNHVNENIKDADQLLHRNGSEANADIVLSIEESNENYFSNSSAVLEKEQQQKELFKETSTNEVAKNFIINDSYKNENSFGNYLFSNSNMCRNNSLEIKSPPRNFLESDNTTEARNKKRIRERFEERFEERQLVYEQMTMDNRSNLNDDEESKKLEENNSREIANLKKENATKNHYCFRLFKNRSHSNGITTEDGKGNKKRGNKEEELQKQQQEQKQEQGQEQEKEKQKKEKNNINKEVPFEKCSGSRLSSFKLRKNSDIKINDLSNGSKRHNNNNNNNMDTVLNMGDNEKVFDGESYYEQNAGSRKKRKSQQIIESFEKLKTTFSNNAFIKNNSDSIRRKQTKICNIIQSYFIRYYTFVTIVLYLFCLALILTALVIDSWKVHQLHLASQENRKTVTVHIGVNGIRRIQEISKGSGEVLISFEKQQNYKMLMKSETCQPVDKKEVEDFLMQLSKHGKLRESADTSLEVVGNGDTGHSDSFIHDSSSSGSSSSGNGEEVLVSEQRLISFLKHPGDIGLLTDPKIILIRKYIIGPTIYNLECKYISNIKKAGLFYKLALYPSILLLSLSAFLLIFTLMTNNTECNVAGVKKTSFYLSFITFIFLSISVYFIDDSYNIPICVQKDGSADICKSGKSRIVMAFAILLLFCSIVFFYNFIKAVGLNNKNSLHMEKQQRKTHKNENLENVEDAVSVS